MWLNESAGSVAVNSLENHLLVDWLPRFFRVGAAVFGR
jgi:hypothetical protein